MSTKISALPSVTTPAAATDAIPIVDGGVTSQISVSALLAMGFNWHLPFPGSGITGAGSEGSPYAHTDTTSGISTLITGGSSVVQLMNARYNVSGSTTIRQPIQIRGMFPGAGNPNGEFQPTTGSRLIGTADVNFFTLGVTWDFTHDNRASFYCFSDFTCWGHNQAGTFATTNNMLYVDRAVDSLLVSRVVAANMMSFLSVAGNSDAAIINDVKTFGVTNPIVFGSSSSGYYNKFTNCVFADGNGPIVLIGGATNTQFHGVSVVRQGRVHADANDCCVYWGQSQGQWIGGQIASPGITIAYDDGAGHTRGATVNASQCDGLIVIGSYNVFRGIAVDDIKSGSVGIHLKSGATNNLVDCSGWTNIAGTHVVLDSGANNNTVIKYKGMTVTDNGTGNVIKDFTS